MMRALLCLCAVVGLLAGCATQAPPTRLYLLSTPADQTTTADSAPAHDTIVSLSAIQLAPYLTHSGIVYQTAPNRIVVAGNNQWAAPLRNQLTSRLFASLKQGLPSVTIRQAQRSTAQPGYRLVVHIERFQGRYDGNAILAGNWHLLDDDDQIVTRGTLKQDIKLHADGYDALVQALSHAWAKAAAKITAAVGRAVES